MDEANLPTNKLTKNQTLVFETLSAAKTPLSAYAILELLRDEGFRAPLQVYRALDRLIILEKVHKLESMNAFVACSHPDDHNHDTSAFTICEDCGNVSEMSDGGLLKHLQTFADTSGFKPSKTTIELKGICHDCQAG